MVDPFGIELTNEIASQWLGMFTATEAVADEANEAAVEVADLLVRDYDPDAFAAAGMPAPEALRKAGERLQAAVEAWRRAFFETAPAGCIQIVTSELQDAYEALARFAQLPVDQQDCGTGNRAGAAGTIVGMSAQASLRLEELLNAAKRVLARALS